MRTYAIVLLVLFGASPAMASLQITLGNNPMSIPDVNNFKDALRDYYDPSSPFDINRLFNGGADVNVTAAGRLEFYYHGSESGFSNDFVVGGTQVGSTLVGGTSLYTENIGGTPSGTTQIDFQYPDGLPIGYIDITVPTTFSALGIGFRVSDTNGTGGTGPVDALAGTPGFGVFFNRAAYNANNFMDFDELFLGFDDNGAGPDDNHDDMIVRVKFIPEPPLVVIEDAPEAASAAMWMGLIGLAGLVARRAARRAAAT